MGDRTILKHQVCFSLYAASRAATAVYRPLLAQLGLTYPQYLLMLLLWERDGVSVKELGEELELDSGTLSPLLKRLESAGFLERRRQLEDERKLQVHLTARGEELRSHAEQIPQQIARAAGLSAADLKQLNETLAKVTGALHAALTPNAAPNSSTESMKEHS